MDLGNPEISDESFLPSDLLRALELVPETSSTPPPPLTRSDTAETPLLSLGPSQTTQSQGDMSSFPTNSSIERLGFGQWANTRRLTPTRVQLSERQRDQARLAIGISLDESNTDPFIAPNQSTLGFSSVEQGTPMRTVGREIQLNLGNPNHNPLLIPLPPSPPPEHESKKPHGLPNRRPTEWISALPPDRISLSSMTSEGEGPGALTRSTSIFSGGPLSDDGGGRRVSEVMQLAIRENLNIDNERLDRDRGKNG
ncbi:hypothetical protein BCR39DRAFT_117293 [Naematelia encephala]|uniref:Uncharacterized protein n=1 Tax=Naematelia encephala TaxID=71784 RepID=A0A1Y2BJ58_9TREE|nr:hypothetical protein BCR39DRAFT_117293 [Naematelia encephala]